MDYFDYENISRGNKAFDVHSNTYCVDADVVPAMAHRHYFDNGSYNHCNPVGIAFDTDDGQHIINWPHHTYDNCKDKHDRTGQRYRKVTRILKRLRNRMQEKYSHGKRYTIFSYSEHGLVCTRRCF